MEERAALLARVSADHGTEIKDPATGEVIGRVAFGTPGDVAAAVDTAAKAQPGWAALDDQERCAALMRAADAIDAHAEELAYVVSREQGKTMNGLGARYEAAGCAAWVRATASTPLPVEVLVDDGAEPRRAALPADRRGGRHHPVELADDHRLLADRPGAADGQHGGPEAE